MIAKDRAGVLTALVERDEHVLDAREAEHAQPAFMELPDFHVYMPESIRLSDREVKFLLEHHHETDVWGHPIELIEAIEDENAVLSERERLQLKWYVTMYLPVKLYAGEALELHEDMLVSLPSYPQSQGDFYAYLRWFHFSQDRADGKIKRSPWIEIPEGLTDVEERQIVEFGRAITADLQIHKFIHFTKMRQVWATGGTSAKHVWRAHQCPGGAFSLFKQDREVANETLRERDWLSIIHMPIAESYERGSANEEQCLITEPFDNGRVIRAKFKDNLIRLRDTTGEFKGLTTQIAAMPCTAFKAAGKPQNGIRFDEYAKMDYQRELFAESAANTSHGNCYMDIPTTNFGYNFNYRKLHDIAEDQPVGAFSEAYANAKTIAPGYKVWTNGSGFHCIEIDVKHNPMKVPSYYRAEYPWVSVGKSLFQIFLQYYSKLGCARELLPMLVRTKDERGQSAMLLKKNWFIGEMIKYGDANREDFERDILLSWSAGGGKRMYPSFNQGLHVLRLDDPKEPMPYTTVYVTLDIGPGTKPAAGFYQVKPSGGVIKWNEYVNDGVTFTTWAHDTLRLTNTMFQGCAQVWLADIEGGHQKNAETLMTFVETFESMGIPIITYSVQDSKDRVNKVREALERNDKDGQPFYQIHPGNCPITIAGYNGGYCRDKYKGTDVYKETPTKDGVYCHHMDCDQLLFVHLYTIRDDMDEGFWDEPQPDNRTERDKRLERLQPVKTSKTRMGYSEARR